MVAGLESGENREAKLTGLGLCIWGLCVCVCACKCVHVYVCVGEKAYGYTRVCMNEACVCNTHVCAHV